MRTSDLSHNLQAVATEIFSGLADGPLVSWSELSRLRETLSEGVRDHLTGIRDDHKIVVDRRRLERARQCPASARDAPFAWSPLKASKTLALVALSSLTADPASLREAVETALADAIGQETSLGVWIAEQSPAVYAATKGAAVNWAIRTTVSAPFDRFGTVHFGVRKTLYPVRSRKAVLLSTRYDALILHHGPAGIEHIALTVGSSTPSCAMFDALVLALDVRRAPLRHVDIDPARGTTRATDITLDGLTGAVEASIEAVAALAAVARSVEDLTDPGQHCWRCDWLHECSAGRAFTSEQVQRIGGIPT